MHRLASGLGVLIVASNYRLASVHRLPAAINDAMSSLKWLQTLAMHGDIGCDIWFVRVYALKSNLLTCYNN